ncbi:hypothetical protein MCEL_01340 [Mycolicibacterium celeriflavum]|uniref:Mutator family transposase n=1 Tax=Mycolicibacterium celeriflavum TaxID=1249101 RepID=A0A7I7RD14_MYCCF|nr:hypothetical protein MCEL_01340 [Mycolicibacterium celeriflavum]
MGGQKECFVIKTTQVPAEDKSAARQLAETFSAETLDSLIKDAVKSGTPIDGADGLLNELTKAVLERALNSELTHHLGYESGDPAGRGSGNSRNGTTSKTVTTVNGPVQIDAPRDRNGSFEPAIVPKKARRLNNINSVVLSLYSRGMTTRDIEAHLAEVYGAAVSRELISNVTDVVVDEIKAWQSRPLDEVYPILYIDGLRLRIKDNGVVTTKVAYLAIGVDLEGRKHALGVWIQDSEGAKFWQKVVIDLRNRGVRDILIACCDGLTGLPDAIRSCYPDTVVQTCVVHVIRNAMRFVSYKDRKKVATSMRAIYGAATVESPNSRSRTSTPHSAPSIPARLMCGATPGLSSCRSWTSRWSCARSSTPPTRSSRSTSSCARSPKIAVTFPTRTPR